MPGFVHGFWEFELRPSYLTHWAVSPVRNDLFQIPNWLGNNPSRPGRHGKAIVAEACCWDPSQLCGPWSRRRNQSPLELSYSPQVLSHRDPLPGANPHLLRAPQQPAGDQVLKVIIWWDTVYSQPRALILSYRHTLNLQAKTLWSNQANKGDQPSQCPMPCETLRSPRPSTISFFSGMGPKHDIIANHEDTT